MLADTCKTSSPQIQPAIVHDFFYAAMERNVEQLSLMIDKFGKTLLAAYGTMTYQKYMQCSGNAIIHALVGNKLTFFDCQTPKEEERLVDVLTLLITHGADREAKNQNNLKPIDIAIQRQYRLSIQILVGIQSDLEKEISGRKEQVAKEKVDIGPFAFLNGILSRKTGQEPKEIVLTQPALPQTTPTEKDKQDFLNAASYRLLDTLKNMVQKFGPSIINSNGYVKHGLLESSGTPLLQTLIGRITTDKKHSIQQKHEIQIQIASYLIENGADVNAANERGWTPLHCAFHNDNISLAYLLALSGANPQAMMDAKLPHEHIKDHVKQKLIRTALNKLFPHYEQAIQPQQNAKQRKKTQQTAALAAEQSKRSNIENTTETDLQKHLSPTFENQKFIIKPQTAYQLKLGYTIYEKIINKDEKVIEQIKKCDPNTTIQLQNANQFPIFYFALLYGSEAIIKSFIDHPDFNIHYPEIVNKQPMYHGALIIRNNAQILNLCLCKGLDVNKRMHEENKQNLSDIFWHCFVLSGNIEAVEACLKFGADVSIKTESGFSILELCNPKSHHTIKKLYETALSSIQKGDEIAKDKLGDQWDLIALAKDIYLKTGVEGDTLLKKVKAEIKKKPQLLDPWRATSFSVHEPSIEQQLTTLVQHAGNIWKLTDNLKKFLSKKTTNHLKIIQILENHGKGNINRK